METIFTIESIKKHVITHIWELTMPELFNLYANRPNLKPPKKSLQKDALLQKVLEDGIDPWEIYQANKKAFFGLYPTTIQELLNVDKRQRMKMERHGLLRVAYTRETRAYGRYIDVPYYSLEPLMELTMEDIEEWKEKKDRKATAKQLEALEKARLKKEQLEEEWRQKEFEK